MSGLRDHIGDEDWRRYTQAANGELYGVPIKDMTREELLVTLGFALTDFQAIARFDPIARSRTPAS